MTLQPEEPSEQPDEARLLKDAAITLIREHGTNGLTVDAVLSRAGLGTRAFYRHFSSKNDLVMSVFVRAADEEAARLRTHMEIAGDPLGAIVAWIDCRLELAFDPNVRSDLRHLSEQAQSAYAAAPDAFERAFATMLAPLVNALQLWRQAAKSRDSDPYADAAAIHNVAWGVIQRQWAHGDVKQAAARQQAVTFCLRGIGASANQVAAALLVKRPRRRRRS